MRKNKQSSIEYSIKNFKRKMIYLIITSEALNNHENKQINSQHIDTQHSEETESPIESRWYRVYSNLHRQYGMNNHKK